MVRAASEMPDGRAVCSNADCVLLGAILKLRCSNKDGSLVGSILSFWYVNTVEQSVMDPGHNVDDFAWKSLLTSAKSHSCRPRIKDVANDFEMPGNDQISIWAEIYDMKDVYSHFMKECDR